MFSLNFMFFCSLIEELCTKEENYKTSCNFNFGHECKYTHRHIPPQLFDGTTWNWIRKVLIVRKGVNYNVYSSKREDAVLFFLIFSKSTPH